MGCDLEALQQVELAVEYGTATYSYAKALAADGRDIPGIFGPT
jgi:hypothetical protein